VGGGGKVYSYEGSEGKDEVDGLDPHERRICIHGRFYPHPNLPLRFLTPTGLDVQHIRTLSP